MGGKLGQAGVAVPLLCDPHTTVPPWRSAGTKQPMPERWQDDPMIMKPRADLHRLDSIDPWPETPMAAC
jgi:hypothetical protein